MDAFIGLFIACILDPIAFFLSFLIVPITKKKYIIFISGAITAAISEAIVHSQQIARHFDLYVLTVRFLACSLLTYLAYSIYWGWINKRVHKKK